MSSRLALLAALALIVTAGWLALFERQSASRNAQQTARVQAEFIAASILRDQLHPRDLSASISAARRRQLDRLFSTGILINGNVAANVYGPQGRITYSTDAALIGTTVPNVAGLAAARRSGLVTPGSAPGVPRGSNPATKLLDTFVPLTLRAGGPAGAFELYEDYGLVAGSAGQPGLLLAGVVGLALLALYVAIYPIPRRLAGRVRAQMKTMGQVEHKAFHDTLTGLPNRALFHDRVEQALRVAKRDQVSMAVMLMDLDRFKEINDTFGHHSGDQLLEEVGGNLREALRAGDTVARLGGDEFAVLAPTVPGPLGAVALAQRAVDHVRRTHVVADIEVDVDASIGVALFPHHGEDVDALLRCADIAMYESKARGMPTLYSLEHDHHSADRLALGSQLRRAIREREIIVYYQPKADFSTGQLKSVEALVRWEHPEHGLLSPDQFIPVAEQTGLIRALTSYVLDTALEQSRRWREAGITLAVAVNITGRDLLDQRFAEEVKDLLRKWQVMPSRLELEITENTVLTDPTRAESVLGTLSALGVRLAIDDFGSGNSSLGHLKRLPIDVLKIDKSFVLQMLNNDEDAAIVRSTIDFGHNLGLQVVAEGVSSVTAWNRLRELGCDLAQGYYLSQPVPADEIVELLEPAAPADAIPLPGPG